MPEQRYSVSRREALRITAVSGVAAAFGGGLAFGVLRQAGLRRVSETRERLGTVVTLTIVHPDAAAAHEMLAGAFAEIERLDGIFSRHRRDSVVGRLNATGRVEGAPAELTELLHQAGRVASASAGAFDVTVLPLVRLYEESFSRTGRPPSTARVAAARELVDHRGVDVHGESVRLGRPGMALSLDGIAKGFIVDRTVASMVSAGAERVLVNAGGDIAAAGPGSVAEPWTIGLQHPVEADEVLGLVRLAGESVATSGDYMQAFSQDRRFHHIVDPRTGYSPPEVSSVNVIAPTATEADALSTALMVLGPRDGMALLDATADVEGVIVTKDGARSPSSGMSRRIV